MCEIITDIPVFKIRNHIGNRGQRLGDGRDFHKILFFPVYPSSLPPQTCNIFKSIDSVLFIHIDYKLKSNTVFFTHTSHTRTRAHTHAHIQTYYVRNISINFMV